MNMQCNRNFESIRLKNVPMSGIRNVMNEAKRLSNEGKQIISLSAGEPDFDTPEPIKLATIEALENGYTHYGHNWGQIELRKEIVKKVLKDTGVRYDPETEVLITCGGAEGINDVIYSTINPGDEVIIFKPAFINYEALVNAAGGKVISIYTKPERNFIFDIKEVEQKITLKTKMIVINNPNNPTGVIYEHNLLKKLADLAIKYDLLILSDEIYNNLAYEGKVFYSMASFPGMKERTFIVNGFSKTYAMTGWRLGFVLASDKFLPTLVKNHQYTTTCLPTFIQMGVASAMNLSETMKYVNEMKIEFAKRREIMLNGLSSIDEFRYVKPYGAFYVMVDVSKTGLNGEQFSKQLLHKQFVATIPGIFLGENCSNFIRLSFAASEESIQNGLNRMKLFIKEI